ncbi:MAG: hypothetical protein OXG04_26065 [Acidobacteria bacterium]|nr:hypothetical protein [Acidobacteriota bacterium]
MPDILTAALLAVPIVAAAAHPLRKYPRQTVILAGEAARFLVPASAYMALTVVLVPVTAPVWLQILATASLLTVALAHVPSTARRIAERLKAAQDAERRQRQGDRPT